MKQICLEPYKPKNIETTMASGTSCGVGDIYYHQDGGVRITYWKCKSIWGRPGWISPINTMDALEYNHIADKD